MSSRFFVHCSSASKPLNDGSHWCLSYYLDQSGFTLVELLIAIAMISVLVTIAIPNVLSELPKFRLNGAAQQVFGDLMTARMRAVSQNRKVKVFFIDGNQYKICDDPYDNCGKDVKIQDNFKGITIDIGKDPIFHPRGTASNMTIPVRNSYSCKSIKIAITGRIRIDPSCS